MLEERTVLEERKVPREPIDGALDGALDALDARDCFDTLLCFDILEPMDESDSVES